MEIEHHQGAQRGFFKAVQDQLEAGIMTYHWEGANKLVIEHTEVDESFAGKGVGKRLVMAAVEYARENKIKILPLCPFAHALFEKIEELRDVLFLT